MNFFLLMFSFFALHGCGEKEGQRHNGNQKQETLLVEAITVPTGNIAKHLDLTGTLESVHQANVIPQTSGTVMELYVREGDRVAVETPLAKLYNPTVNSAAERATIELNRAKRERNKASQLYEQGAISKREYQESNTAFKTAKSSYQEAQKSKANTLVRSPIDGVVSAVDIRLGEQSTGRAFQIVDPEKLRLVVSVPEKELHQLKVNQPVTITGAYAESGTTQGRLERIGPVVDSQTGSVKVFIDVPQVAEQLLPGQFVRAKIKVDEHQDIMLLPKNAIVYQDGQPFVFVVGKAKEPSEDEESNQEDLPQVAVQKSITIGYTNQKEVEILEGLALEDLVVTSGNTHLRDESPIRVVEKQQKPAETPTQQPSDEEAN